MITIFEDRVEQLERTSVSSAIWSVEDAQIKFSELLDTVLKDGPQTITRGGKAVVIVVDIVDWHDLTTNGPSDDGVSDQSFLQNARLQLRPLKRFTCG